MSFTSPPETAASAADEYKRYSDRAFACTNAQEVADLTGEATRNLSPGQLRALYKNLEAFADPDLVALFRSKGQLWHLLTRREPPAFDNQRIAPNARLFRAQGVSRAKKVLLVVFSGAGGGMFISTMRLLMRLPEGRFDVLWLWPADGADYPHGVPGFGNSFINVCNGVRRFMTGYGGVAALGGSLGGYSALRAALLLDLPIGVSLSGRFSSLRWTIDKPPAPAFDPLCASLGPRPTALTAYYSADHPLDAVQAGKLAAMNPSVQMVPMLTHDHNVLAQLMADGAFDQVFYGIYRRAMGQATGPLHDVPQAAPAAGFQPASAGPAARAPAGVMQVLARAAPWLGGVLGRPKPSAGGFDHLHTFNGKPVLTLRTAQDREPLPRRRR